MCLGEIGVVLDRWDDGDVPMATVAVGSRQATACLLYEPGVSPGDHVLVHLGFVVEVLGEERALEAVRLRTSVPTGRE